MISNNIKNIICSSIYQIIDKSLAKDKLNELSKKHNQKIHFIPRKYRILGGLLQSMNIQFGNFIELLMYNLILNQKDRYEIIKEFSGIKSNKFKISLSNEEKIDKYISDCQTSHKENYNKINFPILQKSIVDDNDSNFKDFNHDIDLLFKDKILNKYYYIEIKYNDDHDTGKYVDINRKIIKTYAYLVKGLCINNVYTLTPILFYFTNIQRWQNIYMPEHINVMYGKEFFDRFLFNISYKELSNYMENLSESDEVIKKFNDLYRKVMIF